jgi:hypothetical protein
MNVSESCPATLAGARYRALTRPVLWATLLASPATFGAHPLITEDTGVQGKGCWQFELNTDRAVERGTKLASHVANATLTYGVSDTLDLAGNLPWRHDEISDDPSEFREGAGDATLFVKWRFYEKDNLSLALKPIVSLPSGDSDNGLGGGRVRAGVVGIATRGDDDLSLSGNVGYSYNNNSAGERRDIWSASGSLTFGLSEKVHAAIELGAYTNSDPSEAKYPAFVNFGLIYSPSDTVDLDLGYLRGLNDAESLYSFGGGATFRW